MSIISYPAAQHEVLHVAEMHISRHGCHGEYCMDVK
jgi:hypothetical protein